MNVLQGAPMELWEGAPETLGDALLAAASQKGEAGITYVAANGSESYQSYSALLEEASRMAAGLLASGLRPGSKVILHIPELRDFFTSFWGCILSGIVPVSVSTAPYYHQTNSILQKLRGAWLLLDAPLIITSQSILSQVKNLAELLEMPQLRAIEFESLRKADPLISPVSRTGTDLAYLQLTSGTTGTSKCVCETHRGLICDIASFNAAHRVKPADTVVNWFPMDHILPMIYHHIKNVVIGSHQVHLRPDYVLAEPSRWLDLLESYRATHTWSPNFGLKLLVGALGQAGGRTWNLSRLRCLLTAGEPVMASVVSDLLQGLKAIEVSSDVLQITYGMTECSFTYNSGVSIESSAHHLGDRTFIDVGRPLPGVRLRVLDAEGGPAPEGVIGRIQATRDFVPPRYYPDAPITPAFADSGWIETGDQGFIDQGSLIVTGRAKEMFIVRGKNFFCHEIEEAAGRVAGVERGFVGVCGADDAASGSETFCVFFVPASGEHQTKLARQIRIAVTSTFGISPLLVMPLSREQFPRTTSGKIQRAILRQRFEAGEYRELAADTEKEKTASKTEIERKVAAIIGRIVGRPDIAATDNFFDLGASSILLSKSRLEMERLFAREIPITALFQYPSVRALSAYLTGDDELLLRADPTVKPHSAEPIAVIGMAGRVPGARNIEEFWRNLCARRESISTLTDSDLRRAGVDPAVSGKPNYIRASASLEDIDLFDANFFNYSPREAELLDPQTRIFLECAHDALSSAGYGGKFEFPVGVFASSALSTYLVRNLAPALDLRHAAMPLAFFQAHIANDKDFIASRVAYKLNLRGPAVGIQTACSSSLVAIHEARRSLLAGECDMALAGGVAVHLPRRVGYLHFDEFILAKDGHCRPFDKDASGTVFGDGAGVVVLKRFSDALAAGDHILAVIRGSAANNDGSDKAGYTAPSVSGQANVILQALATAGVDPRSIGYVETHGTATSIGDPIEITALTQAYRRYTPDNGYCAVGSVKSNIGHLNTAAGVTGFIKAVLMVERGMLAPTLHFSQPNPAIDFVRSPFYVNTELKPWNGAQRLAGISAFGVGGTNAHIIIEQAPEAAPPSDTVDRRHVLFVSAKTDGALRELGWNYADSLSQLDPRRLGDFCFTAWAGREHHSRQITIAGSTPGEIRAQLEAFAQSGEIPSGILPEEAQHLYSEGQWRRLPLPGYPFQRESYWIEPPSSPSLQRAVWIFSGQGGQWPGMGKVLLERDAIFRNAVEECDRATFPHLGYSLIDALRGEGPHASLEKVEEAQPAIFAVQVGLAAMLKAAGVEPAAVVGHSLGEIAAAHVAGVLTLADAARIVCLRSKLVSSAGGGMLLADLTEADAQRAITPDEPRVSVATVNGPHSTVLSGDVSQLDRIQARLDVAGIFNRRVKVDFAAHSPMVDDAATELRRLLQGIRPSRQRTPFYSTVLAARCEGVELGASYWSRNVREPVRFWPTLRQIDGDCSRFLELGPHPVLASSLESALSEIGQTSKVQPVLRRDRDPLEFFRTLGTLNGSTTPAIAETERENLFYEVLWRSYSLPDPVPEAKGRWMIVSGGNDRTRELENALAAAGVESCIAKAGDDVRWEAFDGVVFLGGAADLRSVLGSALAVSRLLAACLGPPRLWIVTRGVQSLNGEAGNLSLAPLWGFGRALSSEAPELFGGLIDLEAVASPGETGRLVRVLLSPPREEQIALRGEDMFVPRLVPVALPGSVFRLRPDCSYLVTGGLGRLGRLFVRWLVDRGARHLVLTGRHAREEDLGDLRALPAKIEVVAVDVADRDRMAEILAAPRPPLAGVIHSAGVLTMTPLADLDAAALDAVCRPKIQGALVLDELLRETPLDFFVLCSSAAAVWGGVGQAHYAAANHFLDQLAVSRRAAGLPAISVNWGWWESTAESPEVDEYFRGVGLRPMPPDRALSALERAIASGRPNLTIASVDWGRLREVYEASGRRTLLTEIPAGKESPDTDATHHPAVAALRTAPPDQIPALLSSHLRDSASGVLGVMPSQIDEAIPLSRLGLDSLMAVSLKSRLASILSVDIPLSIFLKGASITELRNWLLPHFGAAPEVVEQKNLAVQDPWVVTTRPCPQAKVRLLCFAYAGGGPSVFREWPKHLPPEIEVCAVQLPGRGERCAESPFENLDALLSQLVPAVVPYLDRPWAMFGHCLGAIVMFELYRRLPQHLPRPLRLFVSGAPAPRFYSVMDPSTLSQEKFHDMLRIIGFAGTEALFRDPEAYKLLMPAVLGDFALAARYRHHPGSPIEVPMSAYAAYEDIFAPPAAVEAWRETTAAPFGITVYPGGHYFLEESRQDILSDVRRLVLAEPQQASPSLTNARRQTTRNGGQPHGGGRTILFCFPNAGGDGTAFQHWPEGLPDHIEVRPLELPGRGVRSGESTLVSADQLAESLLRDLTRQIDRPFAFFGHDFGGLLSFEVTRRLRRDGHPLPSRLLLSACFPPHMYYLPPLHLFPAEKLLEMLAIFDFRTSNATPLTTEKLHAVRADFEAAATYQYRPETPLDVPFEILIAAHDAFVPDSGPRQWEQHTTAGCTQHVYDGDHYSFMRESSPILDVTGRLV